MAKLIYSMFVSRDGYTEDAYGRSAGAAAAHEGLDSYINQLVPSVDTVSTDVRDHGVLRDRPRL